MLLFLCWLQCKLLPLFLLWWQWWWWLLWRQRCCIGGGDWVWYSSCPGPTHGFQLVWPCPGWDWGSGAATMTSWTTYRFVSVLRASRITRDRVADVGQWELRIDGGASIVGDDPGSDGYPSWELESSSCYLGRTN